MLTVLGALLLTALGAKASDPAELVHIALAGADTDGYPNAMTISWQTNLQTSTSECQYGTSPTLADAVTASGTQASYYESWQHHVQTGPLNAGEQYYYKCGDAAAGWSSVFNFTAPGGRAQRNVTLLQVGDMGVYNSYGSRQLIDQLAPSADMLLWSGDICYADDAFLHDPLGFGYEETWNVCQAWLENVTTSLPFMTAVGNHEAECHSPACLLDEHRKEALHNFSAFNSRFRMPSDVSRPNPGVLNMWFSFNIGPLHIVAFDSETDFPDSPNDNYTGLPNGGFGDQVSWLEADLAFANTPEQRALRPWVIATTHRPFYSLNNCGDDGEPHGASAALGRAFEDMLYNHKVDLHFAGHVHAYERQLPVYKNALNPNATTYIVSGAGGNTESFSDLSAKPGAKWSHFWEATEWGVGTLNASPTRLEWKFHSAKNGAIIDLVTLHK